MSENRELTMEDYLAMVRRRLKVILIPALIAPLGGWLISYELPWRYSSTATVLVEGQKVPDNYVTPVITSDFAQRVQTLQEQISSPTVLRPVIHRLALVKTPEEETKLVNQIPANMQVLPVMTSMSSAVQNSPTGKAKKPNASSEPVPGFSVTYTDSNAVRAQKICNALTEQMVNQNLQNRSEVATSTTAFLSRQLDQAKRRVDEDDSTLAAFKKRYMGQLPTDVENNMRMLMSLNTQLDASTQTLSRAQQDKAYTQNMLTQQLAAWKNSDSSANPQILQQQLIQLQAQLLQLQARYTDDYPDVVKVKADIAEVEKRLHAVNNPPATKASSATADKGGNAAEPPEIRQLRLQIHQYQGVIDQATLDQKRLQSSIARYEGYTEMSPSVEEQYKELTLDDDNAQSVYKELLAKKDSSELATSMENQQEGEQMRIAANAKLPDAPSFPNQPLLAAGGLGLGLALGALIGLILELSDKSIRTEKDASAVTDLPILISVPWVTEEEDHTGANGNGRRRFWGRGDSAKDHEHVEV